MPKGVYVRSLQTKIKMRERMLGKPSFFKGKKHKPESNLKNSIKHLGKRNSVETEFKKGFVPWNKGITLSSDHVNKLKITHTGKKLSYIHKKKISDGNKGKSSWIKGKKQPQDVKEKISLAHKGKHGGDKSNFWKGGINKNPYPIGNWTFTLRKKIRRRDNYTCKICSVVNKTFLSVHHIDYNKNNCEESNLISLCRRCHSKTNFNRNYWLKYFYGVIGFKN